MKNRAQRRADFERVAAEGVRRHKHRAAHIWSGDKPHVQRDRFRKKWCGCWMCARVRNTEGATLQELRFTSEGIDDRLA